MVHYARAMATSTVRRTPSSEVESTVRAAAIDLIARNGAEAVTVRGLAAEADVSPMSIYNHFGDMAGVFDAVLIEGFDRLFEYVRDDGGHADPFAALRHRGQRYREFALEHPALYAVMFLRAVPGFEPSDDAMVHAAIAFGSLEGAVLRLADTGHVERTDISLIAQQLWSALHGAVALELGDLCRFADARATFDGLLDLLLAGLGDR